MTPTEALQAAIDKAGSQAKLAVICGCTQGAIWQMLNGPGQMSVQFVLATEKETGVSRHDLRPDIYPREVAAC